MLSIKDDVATSLISTFTEDFCSNIYHVLFRTVLGRSEHMLHFTSSFTRTNPGPLPEPRLVESLDRGQIIPGPMQSCSLSSSLVVGQNQTGMEVQDQTG